MDISTSTDSSGEEHTRPCRRTAEKKTTQRRSARARDERFSRAYRPLLRRAPRRTSCVTPLGCPGGSSTPPCTSTSIRASPSTCVTRSCGSVARGLTSSRAALRLLIGIQRWRCRASGRRGSSLDGQYEQLLLAHNGRGGRSVMLGRALFHRTLVHLHPPHDPVAHARDDFRDVVVLGGLVPCGVGAVVR